MYIKKIELNNIRSFESLTIDFEKHKAGWHVILGTNGIGKSTIIRSIALGLIGKQKVEPLGLIIDWKNWLRLGTKEGTIKLSLQDNDNTIYSLKFEEQRQRSKRVVRRQYKSVSLSEISTTEKKQDREDIFSAAYGSYKRITGGAQRYSNIWLNHPKLAAHLSCFGEDIALDQSIEWLKSLSEQTFTSVDFLSEDKKSYKTNFLNDQLGKIAHDQLELIKQFINSSALLPNKIKLQEIIFDRIGFSHEDYINPDAMPSDPFSYLIDINELSDGYRSMLSIVLELLRQLAYFHDDQFNDFFSTDKGYLYVKTAGIVLIDEIDAHLHPTWQTQIGNWFTKFFPNIQFIVTTHSPIICRSALNGTIWQLSTQGGTTIINQIIGTKKDQLVYGNILDAFETDIFGQNISRSDAAKELLEELATLNVRKQFQQLSTTEAKRLRELQEIFKTDAQNQFFDA